MPGARLTFVYPNLCKCEPLCHSEQNCGRWGRDSDPVRSVISFTEER